MARGSRYRAGNGAQFTATKCPSGAGLDKSCELPFGYIWTPMAPCTDQNLVVVDCKGEALPPVLCLTCLAYVNMYVETPDANQSNVWHCPFCRSENVLDEKLIRPGDGMLAAALSAPVVEFRQQLHQASNNINNKMERPIQTYILVLDSNLSRDDVKGVGKAVQAVCVPKAAKEDVEIHLGLIVFDKNIAMYQLGLSGIAAADVCTMKQANSDEHLLNRKSQIQQRPYLATIRGNDGDLSGLWQCLSAVYGTALDLELDDSTESSAVGGDGMSRLDRLKQRKEVRQRQQQQMERSSSATINPQESPWVASHRRTVAAQHKRCTGEAIQCAIDLATGGKTKETSGRTHILLFTNGPPNLGDGSVVAPSGSSSRGSTVKSILAKAPRGKPDVVNSERVTSAVQYFDETAKFAAENEISVDVFFTGASELAIPVFQALVEPSGGYVLPHESFTTLHVQRNLDYLINETFLSRTQVGSADSTGNAQGSTSTSWEGCMVDMRISSFLSPTHLVGSGELVDEDRKGPLKNERSAFAIGASLAASKGFKTNDLPDTELVEKSLTRLSLGRYDPLATLSVMLTVDDEDSDDEESEEEEEESDDEDDEEGGRGSKVGGGSGSGGKRSGGGGARKKDDDEEKYAYFQCVARYVEKGGKTLVTRVHTHQLPIAETVADFLESVDGEITPVVLGREAVYRSMYGKEISEDTEVVLAPDKEELEDLAHEAQQDLDATIHRISGAFRLLRLEQGITGLKTDSEPRSRAATSLDFAFPQQLSGALDKLFHLRRGPMLCTGPSQSTDDRAGMRSMFLRLPLEDCLCMMSPQLWSSGSVLSDPAGDEVLPVPAETLSLWDHCILAADHHGDLFIWSGKSTLSAEYDSVRKDFEEFLLERSVNRFPMPKLHRLSEGDSMSRRFTARLAPSHADPPEQQLAHFPALALLSPEELTALRSKFRFYDPAADPSFRGWFWGVASAASASKEEGMSLCE